MGPQPFHLLVVACSKLDSLMNGPPTQPILGDGARDARIWRMMKRVFFAALLFAAPARLVSAQDAKVQSATAIRKDFFILKDRVCAN
jgi:hypothetical protein